MPTRLGATFYSVLRYLFMGATICKKPHQVTGQVSSFFGERRPLLFFCCANTALHRIGAFFSFFYNSAGVFLSQEGTGHQNDQIGASYMCYMGRQIYEAKMRLIWSLCWSLFPSLLGSAFEGKEGESCPRVAGKREEEEEEEAPSF